MKFKDVRLYLDVVYKNTNIGKVVGFDERLKRISIELIDVKNKIVDCSVIDIEPFFASDIMKQEQKEFGVGDIVEYVYNDQRQYKIRSKGDYFSIIESLDGTIEILSVINVHLKLANVQPAFTWDNTVHTIDKPFERNGQWYIKVDGSKIAFYDKPKTFYYYKSYDNSVQECLVYAIVPNTPYKYILVDNRMCCEMFLPVTYNPKEIEVTMEELEKKYGCKVKIKK